MKMIKVKIHSVVSEITNSSTVIYTYQDGSVKPAKELINEMLKLSGVEDKTADDIFYFGVFCDDDIYFEYDELPDDCPTINYFSDNYREQYNLRKDWLINMEQKIMKGEIIKPNWMKNAEEKYSDYNPSSYLSLIPKEEKYKEFGIKINNLLNSNSTEAEYEG